MSEPIKTPEERLRKKFLRIQVEHAFQKGIEYQEITKESDPSAKEIFVMSMVYLLLSRVEILEEKLAALTANKGEQDGN